MKSLFVYESKEKFKSPDGFSVVLLRGKVMITFRSYIINFCFILSLFSCVPQQTESDCAEGEVFNPSLRACSPLVLESEIPSPIIDSSTISPSLYTLQGTPSDSEMDFYFEVKNNNTDFSSTEDYKIEWRLLKNNSPFSILGVGIEDFETFVTIDSEIDKFIDISKEGTNTFSYSVPNLPEGNYLVEAKIKRSSSGESLESTKWSLTVRHPKKSKVISRNIFANNPPLISFSQITLAYHDLPYSDDRERNFTLLSQNSVQANYCVELENGDGSIIGDDYFVEVKFYLDNNPDPVFSKQTSATMKKICLSDIPSKILIKFMNGHSTIKEQYHKIIAKVFDQATNEYTQEDMGVGTGNYPITWDVVVKSQNAPPTLAFEEPSSYPYIVCSEAIGIVKKCIVEQDQPFTVKFSATDDFYDFSTTPSAFEYDITLLEDNSMMEDYDGGDNYGKACTHTVHDEDPTFECTFNLESYNYDGATHLGGNKKYFVRVDLTDTGSELTSEYAKSTLIYELTVLESSNPPIISSQGSGSSSVKKSSDNVILNSSDTNSYVTEGDIVNFNIEVKEGEKDRYLIEIFKCSSSNTISCNTWLRQPQMVNPSSITTTNILSWEIPEDHIPTTTSITTSVKRYYKIRVTDYPDTEAPVSQESMFSFYVRNKNPAPVRNAANESPGRICNTEDEVSPCIHNVFGGTIFTIKSGSFTDDSVVNSEKSIFYQWYIKRGTNGSYEKINGATAIDLTFSPGFNFNENGLEPVFITLCYGDNGGVNPIPEADAVTEGSEANVNGPKCTPPWKIDVTPPMVTIPYNSNEGEEDEARTLAEASKDSAIWYDNLNPNSKKIFIAHSREDTLIIQRLDFLYTGSPRYYSNKQIVLGSSYVKDSIKDISIIGNNTHIFVAFRYSLTDPGFEYFGIYKIHKTNLALEASIYGTALQNQFILPEKLGQLMILPTGGENFEEKIILPYVQNSENSSDIKLLVLPYLAFQGTPSVVNLKKGGNLNFDNIQFIANKVTAKSDGRLDFNLIAVDAYSSAVRYGFSLLNDDDLYVEKIANSDPIDLFEGDPIDFNFLEFTSTDIFVAKVKNGDNFLWKYQSSSGPATLIQGNNQASQNVISGIIDVKITEENNNPRLIVKSSHDSSPADFANMYVMKPAGQYFTCGNCVKINPDGFNLYRKINWAISSIDTFKIGEIDVESPDDPIPVVAENPFVFVLTQRKMNDNTTPLMLWTLNMSTESTSYSGGYSNDANDLYKKPILE